MNLKNRKDNRDDLDIVYFKGCPPHQPNGYWAVVRKYYSGHIPMYFIMFKANMKEECEEQLEKILKRQKQRRR